MNVKLTSFLLLLFYINRGVYLYDLTLINEGNPTILGDGLINFSKQELVQSVLAEVRFFNY
jgi:hypothetical protein